MKKKTAINAVSVGAILLGAVLFTGCAEEMDSSLMMPGGTDFSQQSFFKPSEEDIIADKESGLDIIKNVINVTFTSGTTVDRVNRIISSYGGEIVGYDRSVNLYQVRFTDFDIARIDEIRLELISKYKEIEVASKITVSIHKDTYYIK